MASAAPRYAKALFEVLTASGEFATEWPRIQSLANLPDDLVALLGNSTLSVEVRSNALRHALGWPVSGSTFDRFIEQLASRRRLGLIDKICQEFVALYEAREKIVHGVVYSATPFSTSQIDTLARGLSVNGSHVQLTTALDDTILGGFKVRLGDTILDATANNQLKQAKKALLTVLKETE